MSMPGPFKSILNKIEPKLVFCMREDYEIDEVLRELQLNPKIYTFNGIRGRSEAAEKFVDETGIENDFSWVFTENVVSNFEYYAVRQMVFSILTVYYRTDWFGTSSDFFAAASSIFDVTPLPLYFTTII